MPDPLPAPLVWYEDERARLRRIAFALIARPPPRGLHPPCLNN